MALIRFGKAAQEAAQESERLNQRLQASNSILDAQSKKWNTFKEDLGAGLIEMRAWALQITNIVTAQDRANAMLEKNNEIMGRYRDLVESTLNPLDENAQKLKEFEEALKATGVAQEFINLALDKYKLKLDEVRKAEEEEIAAKERFRQAQEKLNKEIQALQVAGPHGSGRASDLSNWGDASDSEKAALKRNLSRKR